MSFLGGKHANKPAVYNTTSARQQLKHGFQLLVVHTTGVTSNYNVFNVSHLVVFYLVLVEG